MMHQLIKIILLSIFLITNTNASSIFDREEESFNEPEIKDPLESINRPIFKFNYVLDKYTLKPIARTYKNLIPTSIKIGVKNFTNNLNKPVSAIASLFMLDLNNSVYNITSFGINSTFGILGIFDLTKEMEDKEIDQSFSTVFKHYNFSPGIYIVLPVLGPQSSTNVIALGANLFLDPIFTIKHATKKNELIFESTAKSLEIIDFRASNYDQINIIYDNSFDPYIAFRSIYYQNYEN